MREADQLRQDMEFRLSLLRLMTAPHQVAAQSATEGEGAEQLERLFDFTDTGYRQ